MRWTTVAAIASLLVVRMGRGGWGRLRSVAVRIIGLLAALVLAPTSASARRSNNIFYRKNGWIGFVLNSTKHGFTGYIAHTPLSQATGFGLAHLRTGEWVAAFVKSGGFRPNMKWDMELLVDGRSIHRGVTKVDASGFAMLEPALPKPAIVALSTGQESFEIVTTRGRFEYNLAGAADAVKAATKCVNYFASTPAPKSSTGSIPESPKSSRGGSGTGFFISADGRVLTNAHVVRGCTSVHVGFPGAAMQSARVVASDIANDLAVLATSLRPKQVPSLLAVRTGEQISVYGFPLSGLLPSTGNFTLGNVTATAGLADNTNVLQISAPVQHGNSGGPVLDQSGNVVGIVYSKVNALRAPEQDHIRYCAERELRHQVGRRDELPANSRHRGSDRREG